MCGLTGAWLATGSPDDAAALTRRMADALVHRGPDSSGVWQAPDQALALGHRRLAIIDLSPAGHQPMASASGRFMLVFNGEIYNFRALHDELVAAGRRISGRSDTAVMLAAFEHWGVAEALPRLQGMFALAVWDQHSATLTLARDRLGEKPLYYGWLPDGRLLFASELKALHAVAREHLQLDPGAASAFLRYGYVPGLRSIHAGVNKLPPGACLQVRSAQRPDGFDPVTSPQRFWDVCQVARDGLATAPPTSTATAVDSLEATLQQVIGEQMVSDVPLGAFLSGGVDSSAVVALMQAQSSQPVRTFTIGFDDPSFNEATFAAAIAKHLGTQHESLTLTEQVALDALPGMVDIYDEPHANPSQIPAFLVSRMAREQVTVCLSGDGGDELFCGYNRYFEAHRLQARMARVPAPLRKTVGALLRTAPASAWDRLLQALTPGRTEQNLGLKVHKLAGLLGEQDATALYRRLLSLNPEASTLWPAAAAPVALDDPAARLEGAAFMDQAMLWDQLNYLPDDNLAKVDRASMAVSLETRLPLLDARVVEHAWTLPLDLKYRDGTSKWLLRQVLYRHVPRELIERPKMGFSVPVQAWLQGALRDWAEALLTPQRLASLPQLDAPAVRGLWQRFLGGRTEHTLALWTVLTLLAWQERWG